MRPLIDFSVVSLWSKIIKFCQDPAINLCFTADCVNGRTHEPPQGRMPCWPGHLQYCMESSQHHVRHMKPDTPFPPLHLGQLLRDSVRKPSHSKLHSLAWFLVRFACLVFLMHSLSQWMAGAWISSPVGTMRATRDGWVGVSACPRPGFSLHVAMICMGR